MAEYEHCGLCDDAATRCVKITLRVGQGGQSTAHLAGRYCGRHAKKLLETSGKSAGHREVNWDEGDDFLSAHVRRPWHLAGAPR